MIRRRGDDVDDEVVDWLEYRAFVFLFFCFLFFPLITYVFVLFCVRILLFLFV